MDGTNWRCVADGQGAKEDQEYKFTRDEESVVMLRDT